MIHVMDKRLVFQTATYEKERKTCRMMGKRHEELLQKERNQITNKHKKIYPH